MVTKENLKHWQNVIMINTVYCEENLKKSNFMSLGLNITFE